MDDITSFRGMAGEVVRGFIRPSTFLTAIPVILFWVLFFTVIFLIGKGLPSFVLFLLIIMASSLLVGRFAIPASRGELDAGFFSSQLQRGETLAYALRYCALTIMWVIPVGLLSYFAFKSASIYSLGSLTGLGLVRHGFHGLLFALLVLLCIFAPTICCILATYTDSIGEVFTLEPFQWIYSERRTDLGPYYANIVGGMLVFWAKYIIPLLILAIIAFKSSTTLGFGIASFIYMMPLIISPILIGRLSGAFIAGEQLLDETMEFEEDVLQDFPSPETILPETFTGNPTTSSATQTIHPSFNLGDTQKYKEIYRNTLGKLTNMSEKEINAAIQEAEAGDRENLYNVLLLAYLYKSTNRIDKASQLASDAIVTCIQQGMSLEAVSLFLHFAEEHDKLTLENSHLEPLSDFLVHHKHYKEASRCLLDVLQRCEHEEKHLLQKKFLSVADAASNGGESKQAFILYVYFMKHFPDATLFDYANHAAKKENAKLKQDDDPTSK